MNYTLISDIQNTHSPIVQILLNRGIQYNDIEHFLHTTEADLQSPDLLANINEGIKLLIKHINANNKIYVQVDADTDGYTSAAFLINYLNYLFPHFVQTKVIYGLHAEKVHGFSMEYIPEDVKLIIAPDSASNEYAAHKLYKDKGVDVLILDHHIADYVSPDACVINNQLCDYPTKSLSGVGIVYKFCTKIDELLNVNYANRFLDLAALGIIADVMDTRDFETQYIIQEGLKHINNPLFKELMNRDSMHFKSEIPFMIDVAWYIAPFINAATRVGTVAEQTLIFEAMLEYQAYEQIPSTKRGCKGQLESKAEQAGRLLNNIKNHQNVDVENGINYITNIIEEQNLIANKALIITLPKNKVNKNLNGLIANKLASQYQRPTLVMQLQEDNTYAGSGRGYDKSGFADFRGFLLDSGLVSMAQGHENAFGVALDANNIELLNNYCNEHLQSFDGNIKYDVDFIWDAKHINLDDVLAIAKYKSIWGQHVDEAQIAIENVRISKDTVFFLGRTGRTLRIELPEINIIKMYANDDEIERLSPGDETWFANVIVNCDLNEWNGKVSPQFKLVDFEITQQRKWYF